MTEMIHLPWRHVSLPLVLRGAEDLIVDGPGIWTSLLETEATWLANAAKDNDALEIGTACGFSAVAMGQTARTVVTVDLPAPWVPGVERVDETFQYYGITNVTRIYESSLTYLAKLVEEETKFGFIFIDGDHSAPVLRTDFLNAVELIVPGGKIAVHDYLEDCCVDVKPTMDGLISEGPSEIIGSMAVYSF